MNISKKYICLFWIGWFTIFFMSSCQPESRYGIPDGGEARVSIQFSMQGNEVVLRATEAGTDAENLIDHVDLYIFNKSTGALVSHQSFAKAAIKEVNTFTFDVKAGVTQGVEYTFVALANMPTGTAPASPANIDALRKLPVNGNGMPASPFVMYGEITATVQSDNDIVHVPMERNCAAIDIQNVDPAFTLENGFWIYNIEQNGYVYPDPSTVAGVTSSLSGEIQLTGTSARAYTHPRNVTISETNPATFIIFKGKMANGQSAYYRTDVNVVNGQQVLEKNHIYRVMITKVTDLGYATLEEAKAATADKKVVYTVSDWDNKNESSVSFFGNYFLKLEKRSFFFDYAQQSESVEVVTNAPGIAITPPGEMALDADGKNRTFTNSVAGWCAVKEAYLDEVNGTKRYLLSVGVFENLEQAETRSAGFYVSATGIHTDDLKVLGEIDQVNFNYYLPYTPNFTATPFIFYDSSQDESQFISDIKLPLSRQEWIIEGYVDDVDNPIIKSISDKNGPVTFGAPDNDGFYTNEGMIRSVGDGKITIRTNKLANGVERKPRVARVLVASGEGVNRYAWWLNIFQDFNLKYNITYPASVSSEMKRSKYVIETPLFETNTLTYDIAVTSNTSWRAEILPKEAESWVSFETTTPPQHEHTSGTYSDETTSFKVIVQPNDALPLEGGYPPARQATVNVVCYQGTGAEEVVFRTTEIVVYQGGYVKIGEDIWLDRNLKTGYWYSREYWNTGEDTDGYDYYYPMLYPYAIPVGLSTDHYGAYARNNTTMPRINTYDYGDDGYFMSGAPQSGYGTYFGRVGYGGYKQFPVLDVTKSHWDPSYTTYNPCPPGWQVPWLAQWNPIIDLVNGGYYYGKPLDVSLNPLISAKNGEMVVHNAGRYITVAPVEGTNGGAVDWYLPAAGSRIINGVDVVFPGVYGQYKAADQYYDQDQIRHFHFTHNSAFIYPDNRGAASSVRCVKVK
ncbi:fimbrial protein [Porphyromonas levii]|uniref:fimbrial protein n=1 Tax=Porphyromonas levii TaxID=28114 RepID=UPI001B8D3F45|nr:fimbrial protein [Porphyromonas levii]MBR8770543.1 hypothetical protein [Porphyromonas levii]